MTSRIKSLFCATVLCAGVTMSTSALADVELTFGIYAPDQRVKKMWQCEILVTAMEDHMSATLAEPVSIAVNIDQNYDHGVEDVIAGRADFAHFPNVDHGWIIHPDVGGPVVAAWREAFIALDYEHLPYLASSNVFFEGNFGYCYELERIAERARLLSAATP